MFGLSPEKDSLSTYRKLLTDWEEDLEEEKIKILVGVYVKLFVR